MSPCRRLLLLQLLLASTARAAGRRVKVFGDDHYAPLMFQVQGKPLGLLVDILQRAQALSGDHYELEMVAWKRAMTLARAGKGGLVGVSYTRERAAWLDYSEPIYEDQIQIVVRRDRAFSFTRVADLGGRRLGVGNGVSYGEEFEAALAAGAFQVERDWGIDRRLRMLLAGRLDAAFIGGGAAGFEAALRLDPELLARREELLVVAAPALRDPLHLGFPKSLQAQALLERFNAALMRLRAP